MKMFTIIILLFFKSVEERVQNNKTSEYEGFQSSDYKLNDRYFSNLQDLVLHLERHYLPQLFKPLKLFTFLSFQNKQ